MEALLLSWLAVVRPWRRFAGLVGRWARLWQGWVQLVPCVCRGLRAGWRRREGRLGERKRMGVWMGLRAGMGTALGKADLRVRYRQCREEPR